MLTGNEIINAANLKAVVTALTPTLTSGAAHAGLGRNAEGEYCFPDIKISGGGLLISM